jgi:hypothetical protein
MISVLLVALCVIYVCHAEINLPRHSNTIESIAQIDGGATSFSGGAIVNGVSTASGLDEDCNNKLCRMLEYLIVSFIVSFW